MNKEYVIKLLKECLSSNINSNDREKYLELVKLLDNIKLNIDLLVEFNIGEYEQICEISEHEKQELEFYKLMCEMNNSSFQLTEDQIKRINELIKKYFDKINQKLISIDEEIEKNRCLDIIIEKLQQDKFILNFDELSYINKVLKDKQVDIVQVNKIIAELSLVVIHTLEEFFNNKVENNEKTEEDVVDENNIDNLENANNSQLTENEFIYQLDNILENYGYFKYRNCLINEIKRLKNNTTIKDIEAIFRVLASLKVVLNERVFTELVCNSSEKIINNVINSYMKLSGCSKEASFGDLHRHVSNFMIDGVNSSYQDFMKNMCMLEELKITPEEFLLIDLEVLGINHNRFKKNILTLEKYHIPRNVYLKSITVLKATKNISDELDMWVELGNSEAWGYLKNRLAVLVNNNIDNFKDKLRILMDLDINITINDTYRSLRKDIFKDLDYISEDGYVMIDGKRYHISYVPHENKNLQYDELMNKKLIDFQDDMTKSNEVYQLFVNNTECVRDTYYNIPGAGRISKNKVYRVFNNLLNNGVNDSREMLIYAITYNSALTKEEYDSVCNYVDYLLGIKLEQKGSVR